MFQRHSCASIDNKKCKTLDYLHLIYTFILALQVEYPRHRAIIYDLGVGKLKDATHKTYQHKEQLMGTRPTSAVDVYSFGVIILEVYTRSRAWPGMNVARLTKAILSNGLYPSYESQKIPTEAKALIAACFVEAEQRPSLSSLLPKVQMLLGDEDIW